MRTVSNIYHNCVPDKIKNRRNTDKLKQRDTVIIACVIWGIINGYTSQRATWNGNSFFDKFYKVQNFFPYAIPIVLDNEPPRM
ncbi:hypothetical protein CYQ55_12695 [Enterococcus faecium]|nr:hypothetical protein CYQ55_12695 [Enterococcus faecium]TKN29618.1 hypothetical protein DVW88_13400 [Enterococcus faecium]